MDVLFTYLFQIWEHLIPFMYVDPNERAVRWRGLPLTNRLWVKELGPGIHLKIPFIDRWDAVVIKPRYLDIADVTCETKDRQILLVSLGLKFWIHNTTKAILEVEDFEESLVTDVQAIVTAWVEEHNYNEIRAENLTRECFPLTQQAALEWGCKMRGLGVNSIAKHRVYRLLTD